MKFRVFASLLGMLLFLSEESAAQKVKVDTLVQGTFSSRALALEGSRLWFASNDSGYGFIDLESNEAVRARLENDTLDLRSIAVTKESVFLLNAGTPAYLYELDKSGKLIALRHLDKNPKVFFDSMKFWNDKEGIAMGDPIDGCFHILITRDAGKTWNAIDCAKLPAVNTGEAAFASSNSSISVQGNQAWIASGGSHSRILHTPDKGRSWQVYTTPIVSGESMTGIFTSAFYDGKIGFISGGNYAAPESNVNNKARTSDSGRHWSVVAQNEPFGYASCVAYVPKSKGMKLWSVGATGVFYSADGGQSWTQLLKDYSLYVIVVQDEKTAFAAGKNKVVRLELSE